MEKPEKVQSSAGYNSGEAYYRADEVDAYLADRDDDLRDEVAKIAMWGLIQSQNNWKTGAALSFEWADAFMTERARRREGR